MNICASPKGLGTLTKNSQCHSLVSTWLLSLSKAVRGARVYAENNGMYERLVEGAYSVLCSLLEEDPEVSIKVGEKRLFYEGQAVFEDAEDKRELAYILFQNGFRSLVFIEGFSKSELRSFILALRDDGIVYGGLNEDLVARLWYLQLTHLRYVVIDVFSASSCVPKNYFETAISSHSQHEVTLKYDLEQVMAKLYNPLSISSDMTDLDAKPVHRLSISPEDIKVIESGCNPKKIDSVVDARDKPLVDLSEKEHQAILTELENFGMTELVAVISQNLFDGLLDVMSTKDAKNFVATTQTIYDHLVLAKQYRAAKRMIDELRFCREKVGNLQQLHIVSQLDRLLASNSRILLLLNELNNRGQEKIDADLLVLIHNLAPHGVEALISALSVVESAAHRKVICDIIMEAGVPKLSVLYRYFRLAKWFITRDILELSRCRPVEEMLPLYRESLHYPHPQVRAQTLILLKDGSGQDVYNLIIQSLMDKDASVRMTAVRIIGEKRCTAAVASLEAIIKTELLDRDFEEQKVFLKIYAQLDHEAAIPVLGSFFRPALLGAHKRVDAQVAAALSLAKINHPDAKYQLRKGLISIHRRVRDVCRWALEHFPQTAVELSTHTP